jgi:hypothetical protein
MKVKHLLKILSKFDRETDVGVLHDNGIFIAQEAGLYEGKIKLPYGNKMITHDRFDKYVIIGNPGDYSEAAYHDNNKPIEIYYVDADGTIDNI